MAPAAAAASLPLALAATQAAWGLNATRTSLSPYTGTGMRIALIDSGFQPAHPDFKWRHILAQSFVAGEDAFDYFGHGTHCSAAGCGPVRPAQYPRYGVAADAQMWVLKVLNRVGTTTEGVMRQAVELAIRHRCEIVCMPIGQRIGWNTPYSAEWEHLAQSALSVGTLILAAAGDESHRAAGLLQPVDHPANCPSIVAVGAVDAQLRVANFSNGGPSTVAGTVDIAAPGVDIFSGYIPPAWYAVLSGTSQAVAIAAGIAALHAQKTGLRGADLRAELLHTAQPLAGNPNDVGAGLIQAPL